MHADPCERLSHHRVQSGYYVSPLESMLDADQPMHAYFPAWLRAGFRAPWKKTRSGHLRLPVVSHPLPALVLALSSRLLNHSLAQAAEDPARNSGGGKRGPKAFPRVALDLATTVERIQQNFCIADPHLPDCPIVFASDAFLELTGYSREEILGRNCRFLQASSLVSISRASVHQCQMQHWCQGRTQTFGCRLCISCESERRRR